MEHPIIPTIKSRAYWRINFRPVGAVDALASSQTCQKVVEKNSVALRGWDFPHVPRREGEDTGTSYAQNYYEAWTAWEYFRELWRMYRSTQFIYYRGLREDWTDHSSRGWGVNKPKGAIGVFGSVIYELSEVFAFLERLIRDNLYSKGVEVSISLNNISQRFLWVDDQMRLGFFGEEHKTGAPKIEFRKTFLPRDILEGADACARDAIHEVIQSFGWQPAPNLIEDAQKKLLERRL